MVEGWVGSVGGVTGGLLEVGDLTPDGAVVESSVVLVDDTADVFSDDSVLALLASDMLLTDGEYGGDRSANDERKPGRRQWG